MSEEITQACPHCEHPFRDHLVRGDAPIDDDTPTWFHGKKVLVACPKCRCTWNAILNDEWLT